MDGYALRIASYDSANSGAAWKSECLTTYRMSDATSSQIAWAPGRDRGMGRRTDYLPMAL